MDSFRFRLNCIDHYQAGPTELDPVLRRAPGPPQRQHAPSVPVIRVFGATETGQKVCAHIHGALPYLYLDYHGSLEKDAVTAYMRSLRASIDHALAASYRRNACDGKAVYVGHITLVKGIPYYGYHVGYSFFLKVYLLNPAHMTRFADLLHQGAILNRVFQPYESHLQYLLQWMCDYNLYGCGYIDCANVQFRGPVPHSDDIELLAHKWHDASIPGHLIADQGQYPRQSHCSLEVDVCVQDIFNRHEVHSRLIHHEPFEQSHTLRPDEKYVPSMAGLWRDETLRRKRRLGLTDPSSSPFPPEVLVSMSADTRNTAKGGWIHEEGYRKRLDQLIRDESQQDPDGEQAAFSRPVDGEVNVQTALESVEDLYPGRIETQILPEDEDHLESPTERVSELTDSHLRVLEHDDDSSIAYDNGDMGEEHPNDLEELLSLDPLSISEAHIQEQGDQNSGSPDGYRSEVEDACTGHCIHGSGSINGLRKRFQTFEVEGPRKKHHLSPDYINHPRLPSHSTQTFGDASNYKEELPDPSRLLQSSGKAQGPTSPNTLSIPVVKSPNATGAILGSGQTEHLRSQDASGLLATESNHDGCKPIQTALRSPGIPQHTSTIDPRASTPRDSPVTTTMLITSAIARLAQARSPRAQVLHYRISPPSASAIRRSMFHEGILPLLYQDAYYSDETDVPERSWEYAGRDYILQSTTVPYLPMFNPTGAPPSKCNEGSVANPDKKYAGSHLRPLQCDLRHWELASAPPRYKHVDQWLRGDVARTAIESAPKSSDPTRKRKLLPRNISQVDGPTQDNKHGFKYSQKKASTSVKRETQYMSIMSLEVHVRSRGSFAPNPAEDTIQSVFWCLQGEQGASDSHNHIGVVCLSEKNGIVNQIRKQTSVTVEAEEDELGLINKIVDIVRYFDPDILTGYEVHNSSWGYLIERARLKFDFDLCDEISRTKSQSHGRFGKDADRWGFTHTSTIRVTGRHMINIWRAMRGELNLLQYTMENVSFHLLHKRIPHYQYSDLTAWYTSSKPRDLAKVLGYFVTRVQLNLDILEANEIVPRTSEQARLLGVDFFSVISRGSQFKVESTMFRIAKPENYILISPSRKQVGQQNALECLPLVMEPQSAFYSSPLLVFDFQSLYPSVMIAYNYCYSTCLGRIVPWRGRNKVGFMDFDRDPGLLALVKDHINIAPNGIMYVKPEMRKSLLAKMLGEILETRVMVKDGMKTDGDDKVLQQLLNNRQRALKLLANVTYGYTSASFSGRMPCSEIADSIVQTGRETLEKAIALIHSVEKWGAEVVYGDTDSLFVYLKGRTRDQAFTIGEEIAEAITQENPRPIKLKLEKVYHPCVLLAKKRYVGFKYESRYQKEPELDAKGIETVRRDGTPAEQRIEERALKILFQTSDLSQVKAYFLKQCTKIMQGRVSVQDFLFAKEVKLGTYSDDGLPPPGAHIAIKRMLEDPRAEPQYGERVPYVVITGAPGARLIDRCVSPEILLKNDHIELDADYYILKNLIPPLERIFNLVGANVRQWYDEMPKTQRTRSVTLPLNHIINTVSDSEDNSSRIKTLEGYLKGSTCLVCGTKLSFLSSNLNELEACLIIRLCTQCLKKPATALLGLKNIMWKNEKRVKQIDLICKSCANLAWDEEIRCDSQDCPVFYTRLREKSKLTNLKDGLVRVAEVMEDDLQEPDDIDSDIELEGEVDSEDDNDQDCEETKDSDSNRALSD